jgi:hypothetical protein
MRINAYLENCRANICNAIRQIQTDVERHGQPCSDNRRDLIQALTELDAFRHGALQNCAQCSYEETQAEEKKWSDGAWQQYSQGSKPENS